MQVNQQEEIREKQAPVLKPTKYITDSKKVFYFHHP